MITITWSPVRGAFAPEAKLIQSELFEPLYWKRPRRAEVGLNGDVFHPTVSPDAISQVFAVMSLCPQHRFGLETKWPCRMRDYLLHGEARRINIPWTRADAAYGTVWTHCASWPLANVWLGVVIESQADVDERVPLLLQTPAVARFGSCRLREPVNIAAWLPPRPRHVLDCACSACTDNRFASKAPDGQVVFLDWMKAAPAAPEWTRSLVEQCRDAEIVCQTYKTSHLPQAAEMR